MWGRTSALSGPGHGAQGKKSQNTRILRFKGLKNIDLQVVIKTLILYSKDGIFSKTRVLIFLCKKSHRINTVNKNDIVKDLDRK